MSRADVNNNSEVDYTVVAEMVDGVASNQMAVLAVPVAELNSNAVRKAQNGYNATGFYLGGRMMKGTNMKTKLILAAFLALAFGDMAQAEKIVLVPDSFSSDFVAVDSTGDYSFPVKAGAVTNAAAEVVSGTLRYWADGTNAYVDMCMQTGTLTYEWINLTTIEWE